MKTWKITLPAGILMAGFLLCTSASYGTTAISKKEGGAKCVTCHVSAGKKDLNDTGKCYKDSKDLKKCAPKAEK